MAITSTRTVTIGFSGDLDSTWPFEAQANSGSPAESQILNLASGNNTITVPSGGTTPTGVTIIPPEDNPTAIVLKGVNGDTGVQIHNTDPSSFGIDDSVTTFVLNAGAAITGVRIIWT